MYSDPLEISLIVILIKFVETASNEEINFDVTTNITKLRRLSSNELIIPRDMMTEDDNATVSIDSVSESILGLIDEDLKNYTEVKPAMGTHRLNPSIIDDIFNSSEINYDIINNSNITVDNETEIVFVEAKEINETINSNETAQSNKSFSPSLYLGRIPDYEVNNLNTDHSNGNGINDNFKKPNPNLHNNDFHFVVGSVSEPIYPYRFSNSNFKNKPKNVNSFVNSINENVKHGNPIKVENGLYVFDSIKPKEHDNTPFYYNKPITQYNPPSSYHKGVSNGDEKGRFRFPNQSAQPHVTTPTPTNPPHWTPTNVQKPMKFEENDNYNDYVDEHNRQMINYNQKNMQYDNDLIDSISFTTEGTKMKADNDYYLRRPYPTSPTKLVSFPEAKHPLLSPPEDHSGSFEIYNGSTEMFKKALKVLATVLPLGLFIAALTPNIIHINTTDVNGSKFLKPSQGRSTQDQSSYYYRYLSETLQTYYNKTMDTSCDFRNMCEIAVRGSEPTGTLEEKTYWWLATRTPTDLSAALHLNKLFDSITRKSCETLTCAGAKDVTTRRGSHNADHAKKKRLKRNADVDSGGIRG